MNGPKWENGAAYLEHLKEDYPLVFEHVEENDFVDEMFGRLIMGAYVDGRLDGIDSLSQKIREKNV